MAFAVMMMLVACGDSSSSSPSTHADMEEIAANLFDGPISNENEDLEQALFDLIAFWAADGRSASSVCSDRESLTELIAIYKRVSRGGKLPKLTAQSLAEGGVFDPETDLVLSTASLNKVGLLTNEATACILNQHTETAAKLVVIARARTNTGIQISRSTSIKYGSLFDFFIGAQFGEAARLMVQIAEATDDTDLLQRATLASRELDRIGNERIEFRRSQTD